MSVLYHGCRTAGANMITAEGSQNDRLWRELVRVGWLTAGSVPDFMAGTAAYAMTELGRIELLEIFAH